MNFRCGDPLVRQVLADLLFGGPTRFARLSYNRRQMQRFHQGYHGWEDSGFGAAFIMLLSGKSRHPLPWKLWKSGQDMPKV